MSSNNFLVIWVPHVQIEINTLSKACEVGGRLIFDDLSYGEAEEMKKYCLLGPLKMVFT
ncbi:hypothetical protein [Psychromonas sp. KJ10-2]|uniref:hypothetical protein n=1 Tax=Psychromonas sp. KJ10-2 TaxID=3391822 RepID=UPI0039B51A9A